MTLIACLLGHYIIEYVNIKAINYCACTLFVFFGVKLLWDAYMNSNNANEFDDDDEAETKY